MRKVRFENHSSGGVNMVGFPPINIPGHAFGENAVVMSLPETEKVEKLLRTLRSSHPALVITDPYVEGEEGAPAPSGPAGGGDDSGKGEGGKGNEGGDGSGEGNQDKASGEGSGQGQEGGDGAPKALTLEEFTAKATVEEKGSGWFMFTLEGLEPFKVRQTKDTKPAVELAYDLYSAQQAKE